MRAWIAVALVAAMASEAHAGACARRGLGAQVLAHAADAIPNGGGVLVGYGPGDSYDASLDAPDPSVQKAWRLKQGKKKLTTSITTIAPGLSVYTAKGKGKGTVVDGNGKKVGAFRWSGKKKAFKAAAPDLTSASSTTTTMQRWGTSTQVSVALAKNPPSDAFAIVVYDHDSGAALTWAQIDGQATKAIYVYASPGRCGMLPPGTSPPYPNEQIEVAWVDRFGRISPHSAPVAVTDASSATTTGP